MSLIRTVKNSFDILFGTIDSMLKFYIYTILTLFCTMHDVL